MLVLGQEGCDGEVGRVGDVVVDLRLDQEVGNVVDGVVVAGVLVVNEDEVVAALLDQDVVGQQVVVREYQPVFLVLAGQLVDELDFLLARPLPQLGDDGLLLGQEDVLP